MQSLCDKSALTPWVQSQTGHAELFVKSQSKGFWIISGLLEQEIPVVHEHTHTSLQQ